MKLAFRFTVTLVAAITVALALNAYLRVRREVVLYDQDNASDARTIGRLLGPIVAEKWQDEGFESAARLVATVSDRDELRIGLRALDDHEPGGAQLSSGDLELLARSGSLSRKERDRNRGPDALLVTYVPISLPTPRPAVLEFSEPLLGEEAHVTRTILGAATTAVVLALVCALSTMTLGVFLVGRPVRALVSQARRIGAGDFSERLGLRQQDEIGELALEFDLMSERLARASDDLKSATEAKLAALDQLRHAERLATVGKLAAGVAHELGTPLQVVSGYARLISDDESAGPEARENGGVIQEQAERMTSIIRQLLDFARRRRAERAPTNLVEVVERAARMLLPIAEKAGVTLELKLAQPELSAEVDGEQIIQVLSNLIVNAVQAMPSGGTVTVELDSRRRQVDGREHPFLRLAVRDRGVGMKPDVMQHVFEPFFTTKGVGGGTGLGLSVAYGIVDDQGGIFEVESEHGQGSTFAVWLPAGEER
jgi:two-component system NtrC family sensor kinase